MKSPHPVALVMPVHNALEYVQRSLVQIANSEPLARLIIVDDASGPETADWLRDYVNEQLPRAYAEQGFTAPGVYLLRNERQQLFTRTVNRGLRAASRIPGVEAICVINSDVDFQHPAWLSELMKPMFARPGVGIVGYPDSPTGKNERGRTFTYKECPEYVTGHCMLLNLKMLREIGVLCETDIDGRDDPDLKNLKGQAHIGSDRLLSYRANHAGWETIECHFQGLQHAAGKSWSHDLGWLSAFDLQPLWSACDTLDNPYPQDEVVLASLAGE